MTTTIDHVAGATAPPPAHRTGREGARWRFAMRLARREVRRRPGRTLLVMLLIAVPVCGMTVVTMLVRANTDSRSEAFARQFGGADLVHEQLDPNAGTSSTATPAFPPGTRLVRGRASDSDLGLALPDGTARLAMVTDIDLNDPIAHGIVLLRSGRFPSRAGEMLLSPALARDFHARVGDTLHLSSPNWTEKVVGIGVRAVNWNDGFVAVRGNELTTLDALNPGLAGTFTLVDLPGHPTSDQLLSYAPTYISSAQAGSRASERAVNWVLVGGIVALAIVGIVISGAFAVGARRQLVTLGQLSANGADEHLLRRTLSLQGVLSGAIGSVVGFGAGAVILFTMRHQFESWIHHDPGPYVWSLRDTIAILVTGTIAATVAAFIPARSAARVPILSALAGRRPLGSLPKRLVPIGLGLFGGGVFVLVLVATASGVRQNDGLVLSAVFGGLLVLAGACCASSVVVDQLRHLGRAARGSARVALRSIVRTRARSAAVVMALAAVNAGAVAVGTAIDSHTGAKAHTAVFMPDDTLILTNSPDFKLQSFLPIPASISSSLHQILPQATWSNRRAVIGPDPGNGSGVRPSIAGGKVVLDPSPDKLAQPVARLVTVTDPAVLQLIGLSARDTAALERYGAISLRVDSDNPAKSTARRPTTIQLDVGANPTRSITAAVSQDQVRATGDCCGSFITEVKAKELGLKIVDAGVIIHNPAPLNASQRASISVVEQSLFSQRRSAAAIAWSGTGGGGVSNTEVRQIVLGIVVLLALIVLAMSLALSAAETRDERDILVSLGARPSTMRAVSSWKAALLSASGALVAVPTGFIPVAVVYLAIAQPGEVAHIAFPWTTILQLVIAAPLIAAGVAYAGSSLAQRIRPTRMSTFATD
jgi:putative ABC transport system permease protein